MAVDVAGVEERLFSVADALYGTSWVAGVVMGMKMAVDQPELAQGILDAFFETEHTESSARKFYKVIDFVVEGKGHLV